jgi:hypothetical protein
MREPQFFDSDIPHIQDLNDLQDLRDMNSQKFDEIKTNVNEIKQHKKIQATARQTTGTEIPKNDNGKTPTGEPKQE